MLNNHVWRPGLDIYICVCPRRLWIGCRARPGYSFSRSRGHRVVNVDLPCERAQSTLDDYANAVAQAVTGTTGPRIIVGHSVGGATIPLAAARLSADRLVFVAAIVPEPGKSIYETIGPATRAAMEHVTIDHGDGTRSFDFDALSTLAPPEERDAYLNFLRATQRRQGWLAITQPWPGAGIPDVPRNYILCTEDAVIPPGQQRIFAAALGVTPIEIDSVHSVFSAKPRELASILASLAA